MSETGGNGNTLTYRVAQVERELEKLETRWDTSFTDLRAQLGLLIRDAAVLANEIHSGIADCSKGIEQLERTMNRRFEQVDKRFDQMEESVDDDVKGMRKVAFSVGGAVLVAAITFAITSLAVYGAPG